MPRLLPTTVALRSLKGQQLPPRLPDHHRAGGGLASAAHRAGLRHRRGGLERLAPAAPGPGRSAGGVTRVRRRGRRAGAGAGVPRAAGRRKRGRGHHPAGCRAADVPSGARRPRPRPAAGAWVLAGRRVRTSTRGRTRRCSGPRPRSPVCLISSLIGPWPGPLSSCVSRLKVRRVCRHNTRALLPHDRRSGIVNSAPGSAPPATWSPGSSASAGPWVAS